MKIALFTETYLPYINGVVTHIRVLKEGLEALGHEVLIVTTDPQTKKHFIEDGVLHCPAHRIPGKKMYGYGLSKPFSRVRLRLLAEFAPDVLHMHQEFSMGLFAMNAAKKLRRPLVYTLHTMYDEYLFYIAPKPFVPAVRGISHQYVRYIAKRVSVITSPSKKAQEFMTNCKVSKSVEVVPNSVDVNEFDPTQVPVQTLEDVRDQLGIREGDTTGIFVGRLGQEKSIDTLLRFWAESFKGEEKMRLAIVGNGPEFDSLNQLASELGIASQVTFTGSIPHDQIPPYFIACDFFITASKTEMMSISMLEGMASGLPAVQMYDELNASQIKEGENGFLYKNQAEMEQIVRRIAGQNADERQKMREQVRETVRNSGAKELGNYMLAIYQAAMEDYSRSEEKK